MSVSFPRSSTPVTHTTRFTDALDAVRPELAALDATELDAVNLDLAAATVTAIGVVPELRTHRGAIERRFDAEEADRVEKLELYARAASQAQAAYLAAAGAAPDLHVLSKHCLELRTMLLADATVSEAADVRQRAFTLFVRTYDELRRAMSYLRWHEDDVDSIIPSLWSGKAQRKRDAADPGPEPTPAPSPSPSDEPTKEPVRPFGPDFPSPFEDEPST